MFCIVYVCVQDSFLKKNFVDFIRCVFSLTVVIWCHRHDGERHDIFTVITVIEMWWVCSCFFRYEESWVPLHKRTKECAETAEVGAESSFCLKSPVLPQRWPLWRALWFVSGCRWRRRSAVSTDGEEKISPHKPPGATAELTHLRQWTGRHHCYHRYVVCLQAVPNVEPKLSRSNIDRICWIYFIRFCRNLYYCSYKTADFTGGKLIHRLYFKIFTHAHDVIAKKKKKEGND